MIRTVLLSLVAVAVLVPGGLYAWGLSIPASTFVIAYNSSLGFEGLWRAGLEPGGNGTRGVFAEEVTISSPFLRAIGRLASPPRLARASSPPDPL